MTYINYYKSPMGELLLEADETGLTGVWFDKEKYFSVKKITNISVKESDIFKKTKKWLDIYFSGKAPDIKIPLHLKGTEFRKRVWEILLDIPYGKTVSYGMIAKKIAAETGKKMSAQAVGGAVGSNDIAIIVPCHRVIGADGSLTGYTGGLDKKVKLLEIEKADLTPIILS